MKTKVFVSILVFLIVSENNKLICQPLHVFKFQKVRSGTVVWNVADNMNQWSYAPAWHSEMENEPDDHFRKNMPYVKYMQLMTAAGGNAQRDLFKNPLDRTVMDDYDFSALIRACRNILRQGLIPHLKLGNVPLKFTADPQISKSFGVNKCPPNDYRLWHAYIKALITALADEFGLKTVREWRFGVVTEYENKDWFSVDDDPEKTRNAYFALYDYTVDALEQVLGKNVCVGAHSMSVIEGLWDEREFITHCARGKNYCTGKKGTRLCFLAASYYDDRPGVSGKHNSLSETIALLRKAAEREGFKNLFYGIDEGRILQGIDRKDLAPRAAGYTWQAAYDAKLYHGMLDENIGYFSHWAYTSNGIRTGALSVSAHTSGLFYKMYGAVRLPGGQETADNEGKTGGIAALNLKQNKLYVLFYAYSDSVLKAGQREISCEVSGFGKKSGTLKAVRTLISDDSNFFDELIIDREKAGIKPSDFNWSSDSFIISPAELPNAAHRKILQDRMQDYISFSELKPIPELINMEDGVLKIRTTIPLHGVVLYEIEIE
jgi:hypothetical protein